MARVVIGNDGTLSGYPQGGGHWSLFLQYLLGLRASGHDPLLLEYVSLPPEATPRESEVVDAFFGRLDAYGVAGAAALLVYDAGHDADLSLDSARIYGSRSAGELRNLAAGADVLWNFAGAVKEPLLSLFPHRVYLDVDPAVVHISALEWDLGLDNHHAFLTVGANVGSSECPVPTHGKEWRAFRPFVHLPMWQPTTAAKSAPFTSVTHWNWCTIGFEGREISMSKRDAYLRYSDVPRRAAVPCEVAITAAGDAEATERLTAGGWRIVDAWDVAGSPEAYRAYIARSQGELCCPKPIHAELRTGWVSDRSVCYLASGRPVVMEDTGLGPDLSAGRGLVLFRTPEEAAEALARVVADYPRHAEAARTLATEVFSASRVLPEMLDNSR